MNRKSKLGYAAMVMVALLSLSAAFGAGYQLRAQRAYSASARWIPPQPSPVYALIDDVGGQRVADTNPVGPRQASTQPRSYKPDLKPYEMLDEVRRAIEKNFVRTGVDETELTYGAIRGMLSALGDRFTRFLTPEEYEEFQVKSQGEFTGIGARIDMHAKYSGGPASKPYNASRPFIVEPMEGSPALKAGVQKGDVILAIDGRSTANMSDNAVVSFIKGQAGTPVKLKVERLIKPKTAQDDPVYKVLDIEIVRGVIEVHPVSFQWLKDDVAWIKLEEFNQKSEPEIKAALKKLKDGHDGKPAQGLILDLRNNPGGLLDVAVEIGSHFIPEGPIVYTRERDGTELKLPEVHNPKLFLDLKMPIVVLINKYSASASEILAGALKDKKIATIVGEHSYGKASVQVVIELKDGGALVMTTAKYLTPARHDITEKGIAPDIAVAATAADEDPSNGQGAQLQKAISVIEEKNRVGATVAAR